MIFRGDKMLNLISVLSQNDISDAKSWNFISSWAILCGELFIWLEKKLLELPTGPLSAQAWMILNGLQWNLEFK